MQVADYAHDDPAGFVDAMAAQFGASGGETAVGANEQIHRILSTEIEQDSRYVILDAALDYLHGLRRFSFQGFAPYMQKRWLAVHGNDQW
jgi:hypothetical protein